MSDTKRLIDLKNEERMVKLERNIYFVCCFLFVLTVLINIVNIINYPYILNGLILEINIFMVLLCSYLFFQKQKRIIFLSDEMIELKIAYVLNKR